MLAVYLLTHAMTGCAARQRAALRPSTNRPFLDLDLEGDALDPRATPPEHPGPGSFTRTA